MPIILNHIILFKLFLLIVLASFLNQIFAQTNLEKENGNNEKINNSTEKSSKVNITDATKSQISGNYQNGNKSKTWYYINKKDTVAKLNYKNGKLQGRQYGFYIKGGLVCEIDYIDGKRHGVEKCYSKNGQIVEELNYKNDKLDGDYLMYSDNGKLLTKMRYYNQTPISLENYSEDTSKTMYSGTLKNGTGSLVSYIKNELTGKRQVHLIRNFQDSLMHGEIIGHDSEGILSYKGQYYRGYMNGKWVFYSKQGTVEKEILIDYLEEMKKDISNINAINYEVRTFNHVEEPVFKTAYYKTFQEFVKLKKTYPQVCQELNIEGTVFVQFVVDDLGQVEDIKISKSAHKLMDAEVISVVKTSPLWTPGFKNGLPVNWQMQIPVSFRLN